MKLRLTTLLLLCSILAAGQVSIFTPPEKSNCPRSQKQADIWYFGEKAGIDFLSGTAVPLTDQDVMSAVKASSVISDSLGNLLFFTDGVKIWDRSFNLMSNATGLHGDKLSTQPCIIVPHPGNTDLYYVFTVDILRYMPDNSYSTEGLKYTLVDMKLLGGMGDATDQLNRALLTPVTQKITAVKHANNRDYWVIVHEWNSNKFYAYPVDQNGLQPPVISTIGTNHGGGFIDQNNAIGYMKASPDGTALALAITGTNQIEYYSFNSTSGIVSQPQSWTVTIPGVAPYGIEFSPDSKKLYATLLQITGNGPPARPSFIVQFDLASGLANPVAVDSAAGVRLGAMQLATDGRIYISRTVNLVNKRDSLDVIYNPTRPGAECNYNLLSNVPDSRFYLQAGRNGIYSLPNFVQSWFDIPVFTYDSCCHGDITHFQITNKANIDSVSWDFGDGGTSNILEPFHAFAQPGTYSVTLTEYFNGNAYLDSLPVLIHELPQVELGDTILLYSGSEINLHAGTGFMEYLWNTGSINPAIAVSSQGDYWVQVKDFNCCINLDSVYVKVFEYFIPNAFTPNGDGLNDVFRVVGLYRNIKFKMVIYDRWGQLIFQSDSLDKAWDGTYKGSRCEPETYAWLVEVEFLGQDIITQGSIVLKGTVILLR